MSCYIIHIYIYIYIYDVGRLSYGFSWASFCLARPSRISLDFHQNSPEFRQNIELPRLRGILVPFSYQRFPDICSTDFRHLLACKCRRASSACWSAVRAHRSYSIRQRRAIYHHTHTDLTVFIHTSYTVNTSSYTHHIWYIIIHTSSYTSNISSYTHHIRSSTSTLGPFKHIIWYVLFNMFTIIIL